MPSAAKPPLRSTGHHCQPSTEDTPNPSPLTYPSLFPVQRLGSTSQCAEGLSGLGCVTGGASTFTWQQALQQATDATFAGHTDWHLPNKNELESLVERRCYEPAINASFFPNTPSNRFWSSSPGAYGPNGVWLVNFDDGGVDDSNEYSDFHVRLVRGGQ